MGEQTVEQIFYWPLKLYILCIITYGIWCIVFQWRTRVRTQQHEREKEQSDHAMMLRELQKLLAEERAAKEQLEHQVLSQS